PLPCLVCSYPLIPARRIIRSNLLWCIVRYGPRSPSSCSQSLSACHSLSGRLSASGNNAPWLVSSGFPVCASPWSYGQASDTIGTCWSPIWCVCLVAEPLSHSPSGMCSVSPLFSSTKAIEIADILALSSMCSPDVSVSSATYPVGCFPCLASSSSCVGSIILPVYHSYAFLSTSWGFCCCGSGAVGLVLCCERLVPGFLE